jgi:ubiquinone/menaquinone biosynthesis C-methylase UbiE
LYFSSLALFRRKNPPISPCGADVFNSQGDHPRSSPDIESLTVTAAESATEPEDLYRLGEFRVALDPSSPAHSLPEIRLGEKVLDVGCGAGQTLIAACAWRRSGEGGLCASCSRDDCPTWGYGIDIDGRALALGRKWSRRMILSYGSAERIPFPDDEFDVVISRVTLAYVDLRKAAIEIRRVLKPGGRVWLTLHPFSLVIGEAKRKNWKGLLYMAYVALNGVIFHLTLRTISLFGLRESWQTGSAMVRLLKRAGFTDVKVNQSRRCFLVTARG